VTIPKAEPPAQRSSAATWADSLDLAAITPEQEMRLGGELNRLVLATSPVDREGDIQRLRKSADPLLKFRARPEIAYTFTILDSDVVNAFSLPGGFIYVSKGLFNLVGEDMEPEQDYALQFALGHEIAHVDLKHTLKLLAPGNSAAKKQGMDTLHQCLVPVMVAYPDAMEFEADAWAYERMTHRIEPPRTQREAWMFLIKFEGFAKKHGFRNGRMSLDPTSGMTLVENHYRAHPAAWERLDRLKALGVRPAAPSGAKSQ
jgi:Zn-dependent protease with chaperone function